MEAGKVVVSHLRDHANMLNGLAALKRGHIERVAAELDVLAAEADTLEDEAKKFMGVAILIEGNKATSAAVDEEVAETKHADCCLSAMKDHMRRLAAKG